MKRQSSLSAAELTRKLNADPEFVARRAAQERRRQKLEHELRDAEEPLLVDLRGVGFDIASVWDLVNTSKPYPDALPILLEHLRRQYPGPVKEGIARALAVPAARFGFNDLVRCYRAEENKRAKDGLAVAIAAVADEDVIDDVVSLAKDSDHGSSRLLLLNALEKSKSPRARKALMELGTDPELSREVQIILRRLRRGETR